jgi:ribosomal RNA-processing protein 1
MYVVFSTEKGQIDKQIQCPLVPLLQPFATLLCRTPTPTVHTKLLSSVYKPIISSLTIALAPNQKTDYPNIVSGSCIEEEGSEETASPGQLRNALLKSLFVTAAETESVESNRRKVYNYWREEGGDDDEEDEE